jgi:hypothetical protein
MLQWWFICALADTYVLILFRVFKCSYNYQHFWHHAKDDNLVHSDVRNVNTCALGVERDGACAPRARRYKARAPRVGRDGAYTPWAERYGAYAPRVRWDGAHALRVRWIQTFPKGVEWGCGYTLDCLGELMLMTISSPSLGTLIFIPDR